LISVSVCSNRNVFGLEGQASNFCLEYRISGVHLGSPIFGIVLYDSGTGLNVSEIGLCSETFVVVVDVGVFRHDEFVAT
jgi:hypothetical protein